MDEEARMSKLHDDILRQPGELLSCLDYTLGPGRQELERAVVAINAAPAVYITGMGSSEDAGMAMVSLFDRQRHKVHVVDTSELLHAGSWPAGSVFVILSRSGKSGEVVELVERAARDGSMVIAVTNTPESPLGLGAAVTLELKSSFDHNVSVTMYSALTLVGGLLAEVCDGEIELGRRGDDLRRSLEAAGNCIPGWQELIAGHPWLGKAPAPTYMLGRGGSLSSCHEAELLWEEAAKAPATAMSTGKFRHGPQEVIRQETRLGLWLDAPHRKADLQLVVEARRYGAQVMLIGQDLPAGSADLAFSLPPIEPAWQFLIDIMPAQLAAEYLAGLRGEDCDDFRICSYIVESEGGLSG